MKISVIIPTLNRHKVLKDTIEYLLPQKDDIEEIILVDQSENIPQEFQNFIKEQKLIKFFTLPKPNLPVARNFGINKANAPIILFLDDDIIPASNLIRAHLKNFLDKEIGGSTGRVTTVGKEKFFTEGRANQVTKTGEIIPNLTSKNRKYADTASGGNMAFRLEIAKRIGGFDPLFIGNAMREESDFSLRVRKSGAKIIFDPDAEIIHLAVPAGGCRQKSRIDWYFDFFHNEYYFFLKHFSRFYIPIFFIRKIRPILACIFYYGKCSKKAIITPFKAFALAKRDLKSARN